LDEWNPRGKITISQLGLMTWVQSSKRWLQAFQASEVPTLELFCRQHRAQIEKDILGNCHDEEPE
jgi:hypothetical protein